MNINYLAGALALAVVVGCSALLQQQQDQQLTDSIKSGEKQLYCNIRGYYEHIDVTKFIKAEETDGVITFKFTNGSATNCEVK